MKLFITDIDDTLSIGEAVADEVREACSRLRSSGWEIMVATGRTYGTARGLQLQVLTDQAKAVLFKHSLNKILLIILININFLIYRWWLLKILESKRMEKMSLMIKICSV